MKFLRVLLDALLPKRATYRTSSETTLETIGHMVAPGVFQTASGPIEALLPYREARVRSLILETKFHNSVHAITVLGTVLGEYLESLISEYQFETTHIVLVPIPLSQKRRAKRGYNQVELISREALPFLTPQFSLRPEILTRVRDTTAQTTLNKQERLQNMKGAFHVTEELHPEYVYVVIDDVATTGATLTEAAVTLRENGAVQVVALALAH